MALITCPECGQQISEHSDHCIHCGCKITVCHTCGKVFAGSGECPVCHAVPAETQKISADFLLAGSPLRETGRVPRNDHENRKSGGHAVRVCAACMAF